MSENKKSEKGDYLTKDEMMSFLKSKGSHSDPENENVKTKGIKVNGCHLLEK